MTNLTPQGQQIVADLAQRHGFSQDAVTTALWAVTEGGGTMAQFNHPEFGGGCQWMQGGMTMVGDMFNTALKYRVDGLCSDLSRQLANNPPLWAAPTQSQGQYQGSGGGGESLFIPPTGAAGGWWPGEFGPPGSTGSQNNLRYAVFPGARRLAVDIGGQVTVYDTLDHQIGGVSQQQGYGSSLSFTSQYGLVRVEDLPVVSGGGNFAPPAPSAPEPYAPSPVPVETPSAPLNSEADVFKAIERLAELRQKGVLTEEEFAGKKAELLSRI
ncbi:SHOCT domain-containing protein [Methylomagnum sp.]